MTEKNPVKKVKRKTHVSNEVKKLAEDLCSLYYDALRSTTLSIRTARPEVTYAKIDALARRQFRLAAEACLQVNAEPREYIIAQFHRWAEMSAFTGKLMVPMPQHLGSMGAQARYIQYKLRQTERINRRMPTTEKEKSGDFYREERKLRGLTRMMRLPPEDVLTERPEEFTRAFLQHKQVWVLVKDRWRQHHS